MSLFFSNVPQNVPKWISDVPIAHRGLHDPEIGIYENTLSAARAACEAGYSIEVDLQPSRDGVPLVFHDYELKRMTSKVGTIRETLSSDLKSCPIMDSGDFIPGLEDLLSEVDGKVGLVLELKGLEGEDDGFVAAVSDTLKGYRGRVAIMSFKHWLLEDARKVAPHLPLGLVGYGRDDEHQNHNRALQQFNFDFLSYHLKEIDARFVAEFRKTGRPIISYTVRSPKDALLSARYADQITFEGFRP